MKNFTIINKKYNSSTTIYDIKDTLENYTIGNGIYFWKCDIIDAGQDKDLSKITNPIDRIKKVLERERFVANTSQDYIYRYGSNDNIMYDEFNLGEKYYKSYSYYSGLEMDTTYYYENNTVVANYNLGDYKVYINYNLDSNWYDCESTVIDWCETNAQEYVNGLMTDTYQSFMKILQKAEVDLSDLK